LIFQEIANFGYLKYKESFSKIFARKVIELEIEERLFWEMFVNALLS